VTLSSGVQETVTVIASDPEADIARVKDKIQEIKQSANLTEKKNSSVAKNDLDLNLDVPDLDIDD